MSFSRPSRHEAYDRRSTSLPSKVGSRCLLQFERFESRMALDASGMDIQSLQSSGLENSTPAQVAPITSVIAPSGFSFELVSRSMVGPLQNPMPWNQRLRLVSILDFMGDRVQHIGGLEAEGEGSPTLPTSHVAPTTSGQPFSPEASIPIVHIPPVVSGAPVIPPISVPTLPTTTPVNSHDNHPTGLGTNSGSTESSSSPIANSNQDSLSGSKGSSQSSSASPLLGLTSARIDTDASMTRSTDFLPVGEASLSLQRLMASESLPSQPGQATLWTNEATSLKKASGSNADNNSVRLMVELSQDGYESRLSQTSSMDDTQVENRSDAMQAVRFAGWSGLGGLVLENDLTHLDNHRSDGLVPPSSMTADGALAATFQLFAMAGEDFASYQPDAMAISESPIRLTEMALDDANDAIEGKDWRSSSTRIALSGGLAFGGLLWLVAHSNSQVSDPAANQESSLQASGIRRPLSLRRWLFR